MTGVKKRSASAESLHAILSHRSTPLRDFLFFQTREGLHDSQALFRDRALWAFNRTLHSGDATPAARAGGSAAAPAACPTPIKKTWGIKGNCGTNPNKNYLGTKDNQPLVLRTNKVERMRIDPSGNVGIGTISPSAKLHIANAEEGLRLQGTAAGATNVTYASFMIVPGPLIGYVGDGSTGDTDTYLTSYTGNVHLYSSYGGVLMAGANGRVGIGTTSPSAKLTIHSDSNSVNNFAVRVENSDGTLLLGARDSGVVHIGAIGGPNTTSHICYTPNGAFGYYFTGCSSAAEDVPTMDAGKGYPGTADLVSIAPAIANPYGDRHGPFVVQNLYGM